MQTIKPGLTTLSDALDIAFAEVPVMTPSEERPISDCYGAILRKDLVAQVSVPSVDNSAMDGYALRHADLAAIDGPVSVVGASLAGHPYNGTLPKGSAIRIATGAAIPDGADCVIIQENVKANADETIIEIDADVIAHTSVHQNIRWLGEDIKTGDTVLKASTILRPQDIAIAAGQGFGSLSVAQPLKVAVFSTGDELAKPGDPLPPGGIYDSNRFAMIGMLRSIGCEVTDLGLLADNFEVLQNALANAAKSHDVIMTSGGVSVGKADLLKPVVDSLGEITAWKLAIKPGKPLMRGKIGDCLVIGLPGNPVSVLVSGLLYVLPLLRHAMGADHSKLAPTRIPVRAGFDFKRGTGRREWLRARLVQNDDGEFEAIAFSSTSSGMLSSMVWAEGLIELPENCGQVSKGDQILYLPLQGLQ
ncbi:MULTISPECIES: gephyrin-like molybdotransferase Glp [Thalassospira]|uniref:Molybdopterin molybdenumtransferase n=2 Tax=Thalassospira tepidiphila TaxID=393657 RepID=A0A853L0Y6_9PROT|nr:MULTISPECIES: gephyrin-like molybdotransferase Glp [Thalassospira]MBO6579412.1 molybdopterin molybdotransferase MoeA [Thalassospira sp.]MBO6820212.1 molybdopterin molybdotransferase MoeA [Thalassospira sp.]MBO6888772.1 molybdopterin molybdotransferase MoeA [Thalassospira sp.]NJB75162.1 molybdopterin molybdotransferase [Thalassospira tepidiphila]OAZ10549.1 molybdopterin biosynthesis protein [Thalassospira tepidiphila MCCC 1A03514]